MQFAVLRLTAEHGFRFASRTDVKLLLSNTVTGTASSEGGVALSWKAADNL